MCAAPAPWSLCVGEVNIIIFICAFHSVRNGTYVNTQTLTLLQLGKSIVAKTAIPKVTVLTLDMMTVKVGEPKGVPPEDIFQLVGKKVTADVGEDESITEDVVDKYGKKAKC